MPKPPGNLAPSPFLVCPCPYCGAWRDLTARISGDVVLCPDCGGAFTVQFRAGGVELLPLELPTKGREEARNGGNIVRRR